MTIIQRASLQAGEIVGVDVDEVLRRALAREGDRVGLDDEYRAVQVDRRRVASDARPDDDGRIARAVGGDQPGEQLAGQLADRQIARFSSIGLA